MRHLLLVLAIAFCGLPAHAGPVYDTIFKTGTLDGISDDVALVYSKTIEIAADPDSATQQSGDVRLSFDSNQTARLAFEQGERRRGLGAYSAEVGNPLIMYFVESVLRDVARLTGGSPFYLRNRIKEALLTDVPIVEAAVAFDGTQVDGKQITLRPFENDENRARMGCYGDLELTFTMSQDVPGWYRSLVAIAPGDAGAPPLYRHDLVLNPLGDPQ